MTPVQKRRSSLIDTISSFIFKKSALLKRRLSDNNVLAQKLSTMYCPEKPPAEPVSSFSNIPTELMMLMFDRFDSDSMNSFAATSKRNSAFVREYYLSASFRNKMGNYKSPSVQPFLRTLIHEEKILFAAQFFSRHYFKTCNSFPWTTFLYNVQNMLPSDKVVEFQLELVQSLKERVEKMVFDKYLNQFDEDDGATNQACRMILSSLVFHNDMCSILTVVLKWFCATKHRALLLMLVFCEADYDIYSQVDLSEVDEARRHLSPLASALQALCQGCIKGYAGSISAERVFSLIENVTTFPSPWVMRNYMALLLLAPDVCNLICYFRKKRNFKEDENEIRDIVFEAVCYFSDWDACYLSTFLSVVRQFNV